jgi:DnaJ like chaperone protein
MAAQNDDPWLVLGLESGADINKTKTQWKKLAAENHPDKLIAKGVPKELLGMANEKLSVINGAYSKIIQAHEMKAGSER